MALRIPTSSRQLKSIEPRGRSGITKRSNLRLISWTRQYNRNREQYTATTPAKPQREREREPERLRMTPRIRPQASRRAWTKPDAGAAGRKKERKRAQHDASDVHHCPRLPQRWRPERSAGKACAHADGLQDLLDHPGLEEPRNNTRAPRSKREREPPPRGNALAPQSRSKKVAEMAAYECSGHVSSVCSVGTAGERDFPRMCTGDILDPTSGPQASSLKNATPPPPPRPKMRATNTAIVVTAMVAQTIHPERRSCRRSTIYRNLQMVIKHAGCDGASASMMRPRSVPAMLCWRCARYSATGTAAIWDPKQTPIALPGRSRHK